MPDQQAATEPADRVVFRLAIFGAVLVLAAAAGFGIGRLTGAPADVTTGADMAGSHQAMTDAHPPASAPTGTDESLPHTHGGAPDSMTPGGMNPGSMAPGSMAGAATDAGGLAVSSAGLTLVPQSTTFQVGRAQPLRFHIAGTDGRPVTTFATVHEKAMHLIVVRRDLTGYQHLHPAMAADGSWTVPLTLSAPGSWRAFADFTAIVGERQSPVTLGIDLSVPGAYGPRPLPPVATTAVADEFGVSYAGALQVGSTQPLLVRVSGAADGSAPLQPYLGAYGHLVAIREGDLGYLHVHPEPQLVDGAVKFWLAAPSPGRYRMFFDFQVDGKVHTAAFTTTVR